MPQAGKGPEGLLNFGKKANSLGFLGPGRLLKKMLTGHYLQNKGVPCPNRKGPFEINTDAFL